jgi:PAS domain S-box-containing protein
MKNKDSRPCDNTHSAVFPFAQGAGGQTELRRQVENMVLKKAAQSSQDFESLSPEETRRMLHELQVHQIELEMQNEELRTAQKELNAARARYFDLYDLAPVGYCTLSEKGLILESNLTLAALLGVARSALVTTPIFRFILKADQDIYYRHRKQLFETGTPQTCELRMLRADDRTLWVRLDATAILNADAAPEYRVTIIDITERKQLEDAQLFLLECGTSIAGQDFFKTLAQYLAESLKMDYVCIDRLEGTGLTARTLAVWFDGHFEDNVSYTLKDTPCGDVVGKTVCCFARHVSQLFPQDRVLQEIKAESYIGSTLWGFDGKPIGLIALISRNPLENSSRAESILKLVAIRAAAEMEHCNSQAALENRIKERTLALCKINDKLKHAIRERSQSQNALKESEERYRSIFHNQHANMMLIDSETLNIVDANPAACEFYGYAFEEMTTKKLTDISILTPDMVFQKAALILTNQKEHFFFSHRLSDGRIREVEVFVCTVQITGRIFFYAIILDNTERRQVERRLIEVSEFIQKIFDASPVGIIAYDTSGQCVMINDAAAKTIGASRDEVLKQNFNHLDSWKKSGLLTAAQEVIQTNQPRENLELRLMTSFDKDVTLNGSLIPFSSAGKPHLLLIGQDVSRQKQADEALRQNQKLAAIGLLVAGIAHEINNPNGFIIFNLPILREYLQELMPFVDDFMADHPNHRFFGRPYEEFRNDLYKLLENIEHGAHRINSVVSGLTDFSRKHEKLLPRRIDLKQVIDHAVSFCRSEINKHVRSFELDIPETLPPASTDPEAVEQILVNLLINAAHASNKENSWIRLRVSADIGSPDRCIIAVDDNGCGMDEKTMKRIFDPFFTRNKSTQGTGLGLYICQSLVEGLGGCILVESQPDQGSSFKVILSAFL